MVIVGHQYGPRVKYSQESGRRAVVGRLGYRIVRTGKFCSLVHVVAVVRV